MDRSDLGHNRSRSPAHAEVVSGESDELLAARAATDPSAFAELYRRYVVRIHRYCDRRLHDPGLVEDATSQVFLKALESLRRKRIDNVASWLFAIAHNEVIDHYRRRRNDVPLQQMLEIGTGEISTEEIAVQRLESGRLHALLPLLSADQQRVLELRLGGLTTREIQDVLGKGESWVKVTQHRALNRLRDLMDAPGAGKGS